MKINRIPLLFFVCYVFGCSYSVLANDFIPGEKSSSYSDFYGIVNVVYPQESRMIISDISLKYTSASLFQNVYGSTIFNPMNELKSGMPVKYHVIHKKHELILKDLKVISRDEFERSRRLGRDNEH